MELTHINDFYYLNALQHEADKHEIDHKWTKISEKVAEAMDELVPKLSESMYSYLFLASMGEARHAARMSKTFFIPEIGFSKGRGEVFANALAFDPKACLPVLEKVFDHLNWVHDGHQSTSYGGRNWQSIVKGAQLFHSKPPAFFIDHAVDLQHNGGTAFSKTESSGVIEFRTKYRTSLERLNPFLSFKKNKNILTTEPFDYVGMHPIVSPSIKSLLERAGFTVAVSPDGDSWKWESVEWGKKKITLEEKWSAWAELSHIHRNYMPLEQLMDKVTAPEPITHALGSYLISRYGTEKEFMGMMDTMMMSANVYADELAALWSKWRPKDKPENMMKEIRKGCSPTLKAIAAMQKQYKKINKKEVMPTVEPVSVLKKKSTKSQYTVVSVS